MIETADTITLEGNGVLFDAPDISVIPVISPDGTITLEVRVFNSSGQQVAGKTEIVTGSDLTTYDAQILTIIDDLLDACEKKVMAGLVALNPSATIVQT